MNEESSTRVIKTPIGPMTAIAVGGAITSLQFGAVRESGKTSSVISEIRTQLDEYFAGKRRKFDLPLMPAGTAFQKLVWWELCEIPFGQTCTYGDIAGKLGKVPGASRAIGGANGKNPIAIVIPCHRVIAAGGKLGGYSGGGPKIKRWLLDHESAGLFNA